MARADLVLNLVKTGIEGDHDLFRKTVQAIAAEEHSKQHYVLAERLTSLLENSLAHPVTSVPTSNPKLQNAFYEIKARKTLDDLVLPKAVTEQCRELIEEHQRRDLLRSYNLEPRHKILLSGSPGNGKTSLAEAMAAELMVPLFIVKYEGIIGSLLGETAQQLESMFEHIKTQRCVLFFDEFDAIGKERADNNEIGEIKRVVNSLLLQLDNLPSHVVLMAATNHPGMLDSAAWRRFQLQMELPKPTKSMTEKWFRQFEDGIGHSLGYMPKTLADKLKGSSFAELEMFALDVQRRYVLQLPNENIKSIVSSRLKQMNK